jgi:two-component system CheB/CheR fusion protein
MSVMSEDGQLESLLEYLRQARGFDLGGYKRTTLKRRTGKRLQALGLGSFAEYQAYLEQHPEESDLYFDTLLINVSRFFRDPEAWDSLKSRVVPHLIDRARQGQVVRVWSTGCSNGQEAYTVAMILAEELGAEDYRQLVKVYATDMDGEALSIARNGTFTEKDVVDVPEAYRKAWLEQVDGAWQVRGELRRAVVFGRHDLVSDAPISRLDLLVCRNTLMYFNTETQAGIAARLHFALRPDGFLFLGKAETVVGQSRLFAPLDVKYRIFRPVPRGNGRLAAPGGALPADKAQELHRAVFETSPIAQVVLDGEDRILGVNQRARRLFDMTGAEVGTPLKDLAISYRPLELRSKIEEARKEGQPVKIARVDHALRGITYTLDVEVFPQPGADSPTAGVVLSFHDVSGLRRLEEEAAARTQELENAQEALQSTVEELETTNEELQSTVEELETTNEELQSTNEEMETMNEELQSTNEELQTANDELRERTSELHGVNSFLESILTSVRTGVIVVDRSRTVMTWNRESEELWGVRREEAYGKHLADLDIGLPVARFEDALVGAMAGRPSDEIELAAVNRRGHRITCRVQILPLLGLLGEIQGGLLLVRTNGEPLA